MNSGNMAMKISVIIAAYDKPHHLERSLHGYIAQDDTNFEVILTQDGEAKENREIIESVIAKTDLSIRHLTLEDKGFRKPLALNRGIAAAEGEYLIFTDDDCIPKRNFVSTHRKYARPGQYIFGSHNWYNQTITDKISNDDAFDGRAFNYFWLMRNGYFAKRGYLRLLMPNWVNAILDMRGVKAPGRFPGRNSSCYKADAVRVGGFNEDMAYGLEDREFGTRLCNVGVVGRRIKHSTFVFHLEHDRPYKDAEKFKKNAVILQETERTKRIRSSHLDPK